MWWSLINVLQWPGTDGMAFKVNQAYGGLHKIIQNVMIQGISYNEILYKLAFIYLFFIFFIYIQLKYIYT